MNTTTALHINGTAAPNHAIFRQSGQEIGLIIVTVREPHLMPVVRSTFEQMVLKHDDKIGLSVGNPKKLIAFIGGANRAFQIAELIAATEETKGYKARKDHVARGTRAGFDLTSNEGLCTFIPILTTMGKNSWVTAQQPFVQPASHEFMNGLARIHELAHSVAASVMLFMSYPDDPNELDLSDFYEHIHVRECEPDPGCAHALEINYVNLKDTHALGAGHMMCSIKQKGGKYLRRYERFVSAALKERVMWKMRCQGMSLAEIGELIKLNKSNVKRHLDKMPPTQKLALPKDWLNPYAEILEFAALPPINNPSVLGQAKGPASGGQNSSSEEDKQEF